jgi:OOP family OmpA-OmpF porin
MKITSMRKSFLPTALATAMAMPAFAANPDGAYTLSPFVGGHDFDSQQQLETSPIFGARAGYNFTPHWTGEFTLGYTLAESEVVNYPETDAYLYTLDALYHFNPEDKLVPYVALGIGGMTLRQPAPGFPDSEETLINAGVGLKYFIADRVALRGDLRQLVGNDNSNLVYTMGVTMQVGGAKTVAAACVPCAADGNDKTPPFVTLASPFHGAADVMPTRPVRVAFSEPVAVDNINDRSFTVWQGKTQIAGKVVAVTPTTATFTHSGEFAPGTMYTARIKAGIKDNAGNAMVSDYVWSFATTRPVAAADGKTVTIDKLVMLEDTHFKFDSAALTPAGEVALEQNIRMMHENPKMTARIAGYSSASGTEEYNQALSERRANTVRAYIIDHGDVAPERLDSIGYGESRPAIYEELPDEIRSKAAKANMRVLFEVIVK